MVTTISHSKVRPLFEGVTRVINATEFLEGNNCVTNLRFSLTTLSWRQMRLTLTRKKLRIFFSVDLNLTNYC